MTVRLPSRWVLPLASLLALAACSGGQSPQRVQPVAPVDSVRTLGALQVRYNALPSLALPESAAQAYGLDRGAGRALVIVALRQRQGDDEVPVQGSVRGVAVDLSGRRQQITFKPVRTGDAVDQVGSVEISPHDTLRFELDVASDLGGGPLRFERSF
ncbi:DUF4426 domain-containing protein [Pseudoxanthomonas winnipegensis]|jgi:hypothetical protein|uniref:DUF4426 domain-containing protein n=1 Tax=Pseudoxanthomonas winnipegensis TaxID=2480810 RepID=A0A4Q8LDS2_9GAMM|nr:DUF4426 domain-containing protein [Pseudoxanthomonas winnipegensis]TAA27074.1 DUF4426 domain-containing protein [Pseudoxanthomonas winnipegensis]